jgi:hypothetical protein
MLNAPNLGTSRLTSGSLLSPFPFPSTFYVPLQDQSLTAFMERLALDVKYIHTKFWRALPKEEALSRLLCSVEVTFLSSKS